MVRKLSVPVLLALLASNAWSSDSANAAAPSGFEPVFTPTPAPTFVAEPAPAAVVPAPAAEAVPAIPAFPVDSTAVAPAPAAEAPAQEPQIEVITQAEAPKDAKSVQLAKEQAIRDSILTVDQAIANACASIEMPPFAPKDEFETSEAFTLRKTTWEKSKEEKCAGVVAPLKKKKDDLTTAFREVQKQGADLKGSLEITSNPKGARIFIDGIEMGKSPTTIEDLWAGKVQVKLILDGYQEFFAAADVKGKDNVELAAILQEKSIFSEMDEVNLSGLLAKDTPSVAVYQTRISRIQTRLEQVKGEFETILLEIRLKNPLPPKNEFETQEAYDKRQADWKKKDDEATGSSRGKYELYKTRLSRAIEVLQDYILVAAGEPKSLDIPAAQMTLGAYNADASQYAFTAQNEKDGFSFLYEGSLKMSPEDAKATNKVSDGFKLTAKYYDIPVVFNGSTVYPAWHSLVVDNAGKNFPADGKFKLPATWYEDASVAAAIARADSLRKGLINVRGLEAAYALEYGASSTGSGSSRVLMWVARGILFASSAAIGGYGYLQQKKADDLSDQYNPQNAQQGRDKLQDIRDKELVRDRAYFGSAILAVAGAITFAF